MITSLSNEIAERELTLNRLKNKETLEHIDRVLIEINRLEIRDFKRLVRKFSKSNILFIA